MKFLTKLFGRGHSEQRHRLAVESVRPAPSSYWRFALFVFDIRGGYATTLSPTLARTSVADHVGRIDVRVLSPDYYAAHGELLSPENVAIAVNSADWYPDMSLLRIDARKEFTTGALGLREAYYVVGIGGVADSVILEAHQAMLRSLQEVYRGVVLWAFPDVQLVGDMAASFKLAIDPLTRVEDRASPAKSRGVKIENARFKKPTGEPGYHMLSADGRTAACNPAIKDDTPGPGWQYSEIPYTGGYIPMMCPKCMAMLKSAED